MHWLWWFWCLQKPRAVCIFWAKCIFRAHCVYCIKVLRHVSAHRVHQDLLTLQACAARRFLGILTARRFSCFTRAWRRMVRAASVWRRPRMACVAGSGTHSASPRVGFGWYTHHDVVLLRPLFCGAAAGAWDHGGVGAPCAVQMAGSSWRLYYAGRGARGTGPWEGVGVALSEGEPVFHGLPVAFARR